MSNENDMSGKSQAIDPLRKHSPYSGIWARCTGLKAVGAYTRLRKMPFTNLQHLPSTESRLNQFCSLWLDEIHLHRMEMKYF